jgi:DNA-binding response OmpR family regulator
METGPMKILIADDEQPICELLTEFLSRMGCEVFTAGNGRDAVSKFKSVRPELVLLDILMPGENGLDVLRKIKEIDAEAGVFMVSAFCDTPTVESALAVGADCYLQKPIELRKLWKTLEAWSRTRTIP